MRIGLTSEALIIAGAFLYHVGQTLLGGAMISLGTLGGIISFLYFVSRASNFDGKKNLIYQDLRTMFSLINHTIGSLGDHFDKKRKDDSVLH